MEHLNYCRQLVKQLSAQSQVPSWPLKDVASHLIDLVKASQKFLLPDGGRLYDDPELRALDESELLCLPFQFIALEWSRARVTGHLEHQTELSSKGILFARQRDDVIIVRPVAWSDADGTWVPMPECAIPRTHYLGRNADGRTTIKAQFSSSMFPPEDYMDELGTLLCLLNVLQCKNVHLEQSRPKKGGKVKSALPFDSYHVLMIDSPAQAGSGTPTGGHRSPREHLRRGHIRRLADSRRVWVNATVVAAGRGAGVVTKDYALRAAA